jgi:hypothetical protein
MTKKQLAERVEAEIQRLASTHKYDEEILREFALFVAQKEPTKGKKKANGLSLPELKLAIYRHFQVEDTPDLKRSGAFKMATSGMGKIDLSKKAGWESLYRKVIGILPSEEGGEGYGYINGIDIFKYDLPWKAFGLDPQVAKAEDIKTKYRELSKVYHPDIPSTGDATIFDRLTVFYKSLTERF